MKEREDENKAREFSMLQGDVPVAFAFQQGAEWSRLETLKSCAASPWTYRDSNGDGTGKVVETAELPEEDKDKLYLFKVRWMPNQEIIILTGHYCGGRTWFIAGNVLQNEMETEIIAWAVIQGGK